MKSKLVISRLDKESRERKQTEAALLKSEAFLKTLFDSIHDPFCIIDETYRIVRANDAYAGRKNSRIDDLIGEVCYSALEERDSVCDGCVVHKTFLSGDPCAKEKCVTSFDGLKTWVEIYTYPIKEGGGRVSHVIEYTRDITERKRAEAALRVSEERYALAARGANDGLWDWDLESNTVYYSFRWKEMLGLGDDEIGERPDEWLQRVHENDRSHIKAKITAHIAGHTSHFESECRILHKDGTYRWVLNRGLAMRNQDGRAYRMAGSQTDITDRKIAEELLLHDAFHDALTGLPNRALFMDRLNRVILGSRRSAVIQYAVLFLDIDRFKFINDSKGHTIGDLLLIAVSRKLSDCLRPTDTLARLGGDEFAVLLEDITIVADAEDVARRVLKGLLQPFRIQEHELFTSASIGIAMGSSTYTQPDQILCDADIAMYHAKAKGKACYAEFRPAMHDRIVDRLQLEADLHRAVERKEFLLHYQPIMDLKTRRLKGFEALIRWNHPEKGSLYPKEFIPVAEETGLIFPISEWTFREACLQLRKWQEQYPAIPAVTMSVNISGKLFCWPDFTSILSGIISETGIRGDCLALEIAETVIMANVETAEETMTGLKDMGVHIHIDDFGTGYSSLNYLRKFPVSALKIDPSFISKITANGGQREIIGSIVSLASSLNMDVIAEGVEMSHQLFNIRGMKCRYAQGMLFSAPMEPSAIDNWMTGVICGKLEL